MTVWRGPKEQKDGSTSGHWLEPILILGASEGRKEVTTIYMCFQHRHINFYIKSLKIKKTPATRIQPIRKHWWEYEARCQYLHIKIKKIKNSSLQKSSQSGNCKEELSSRTIHQVPFSQWTILIFTY